MRTNRNTTVVVVAFACACILTALTTSGPASAERKSRTGLGEVASGNGKCEPAWHPLSSGGEIGINLGNVLSQTVWNGDLIAAGDFLTAGGQTVRRIARWDGSAWHPFTTEGHNGMLLGEVYALTVWNGDLIAGGFFNTAGGQTVNHISRWDGSTWHTFTSDGHTGLPPTVFALTVWNGDLIIGGQFTTAGGQTVNRIARWDGSSWQPFTSGGQIGMNNGTVSALTVWNGDLVAAGSFGSAGGQVVGSIARWDGLAWHPLNSGGQIGLGGIGRALTVWNGDLIAGGQFTTAGGQTVNRIARWDGSAWHPFTSGGQTGISGSVWSLSIWNDDLVAGGQFTVAGGQTVNRITRWDGSAWHPFTSGGQVGVAGNSIVNALTSWNGDLIAGGSFFAAGGQSVNRIARWDGCLVEPNCLADLNCDDVVNVSDLLMLLGQWGECAQCAADLNDDGSVNVSDLLMLLGAWGASS